MNYSRAINKDAGAQLAKLRDKLSGLERLPENEASRFQLETEICKLEREQDGDEWDEFIDA